MSVGCEVKKNEGLPLVASGMGVYEGDTEVNPVKAVVELQMEVNI